MPDKPKPLEASKTGAWGVAFSAGTELVVYALGGFLLGQWLDRRSGSEILYRLLGAVMGIFVGLYRLVRTFSKRPGGR